MTEAFVAKKLRDQLLRAEAALDAAMHENAQLLSCMLEARRDLQMASTVGAKETAQLTRLIEGLGSAHSSMAEIHNGLAAIARRRGLAPKATGAWKDDMSVAPEDRPVMHRAV